jgi:hypothetical protein
VDEAKPFTQRSNIGSRVTREGHARFWERPEVQFLRATRHCPVVWEGWHREVSPYPDPCECFSNPRPAASPALGWVNS